MFLLDYDQYICFTFTFRIIFNKILIKNFEVFLYFLNLKFLPAALKMNRRVLIAHKQNIKSAPPLDLTTDNTVHKPSQFVGPETTTKATPEANNPRNLFLFFKTIFAFTHVTHSTIGFARL